MEILQQKIKEGLNKGQLKEGLMEFESPVFFIAKKEGEDLWLVVNYHKLNAMTVLDKYYMPDTRVELNKLKGTCLFSKFDIKDGYHNILIEAKDRHKAAFKTPLGTYILEVMTFGLQNTPLVFQ
jgi:hypothetical protein